MTDDLTREHERALLACALLGGAHNRTQSPTHWDLPPGTSTRKFNKLASAATPYSHPSVTRQASRLGQVNVPP